MLKNQLSISIPSHKISLKPLTCLALGGLASMSLMVAAKPATALTMGFQSEYAPANWTLTNSNADGSVNTAAAPTSISLTGGNNGSNTVGRTSYTITAPSSGTVSFDWSYTTPDSVTSPFCTSFPNTTFCDPLIRVLNGAETILISPSGGGFQNGSDSFAVIAGDVFGFRIDTSDNRFGAATTTFSNFSAPSATPVPFEFSPVVGLTMLGVGYGVKRLWHKKKATKL